MSQTSSGCRISALLAFCLALTFTTGAFGAGDFPGTGVSAEPIEIALGELFEFPVGPRGLEYSAKARSANGRRVHVVGYLVRQAAPIPWTLLLAPVPQTLHEREYGLCDDLPMNTLHVLLPRSVPPILPHRPGLVELTATLELGSREEADGRRSVGRLVLTRPDIEALRPAVPSVAAIPPAGNAPSPGSKTHQP